MPDKPFVVCKEVVREGATLTKDKTSRLLVGSQVPMYRPFADSKSFCDFRHPQPSCSQLNRSIRLSLRRATLSPLVHAIPRALCGW